MRLQTEALDNVIGRQSIDQECHALSSRLASMESPPLSPY
jgi:hypothetical protein